MTDDLTRRDVVAGIGSVAAAGSLAGCGGDSGTTGDGNADDTEDGGDGTEGGDGGTEGGDGTTTVEMTDQLAFEPEEVTVSPGTTVVWDNVGSVGHSVTAYEDEIPDDAEYWASGGFDSQQAASDAYTPGDTEAGDVPAGESWEHTFETTGTHEYFCIPHEGSMTGTVVVEES